MLKYEIFNLYLLHKSCNINIILQLVLYVMNNNIYEINQLCRVLKLFYN